LRFTPFGMSLLRFSQFETTNSLSNRKHLGRPTLIIVIAGVTCFLFETVNFASATATIAIYFSTFSEKTSYASEITIESARTMANARFKIPFQIYIMSQNLTVRSPH
jgi:hypothetical protein